jgi:hypothetical protein
MDLSTATTRTQLGGWQSTGSCMINPTQYMYLDTGLALGWFANGSSLAVNAGFPPSGPCFHRHHVRIWHVPTIAFGNIAFGTPHYESWSITHHVISWEQGRDRLFNDYVSYPWGNSGSYYCGWVWPGTYGGGGAVSCGIELTWSPF